jgi:hypothetical protein
LGWNGRREGDGAVFADVTIRRVELLGRWESFARGFPSSARTISAARGVAERFLPR